MRDMSLQRSQSDDSHSSASTKPLSMAARGVYHGITVDMFCQLSSFLHDDSEQGSAPGALLLGLVEGRCTKGLEVLTPSASLSPGTPVIAEDGVTSADVFSFPSPRRLSSV